MERIGRASFGGMAIIVMVLAGFQTPQTDPRGMEGRQVVHEQRVVESPRGGGNAAGSLGYQDVQRFCGEDNRDASLTQRKADRPEPGKSKIAGEAAGGCKAGEPALRTQVP